MALQPGRSAKSFGQLMSAFSQQAQGQFLQVLRDGFALGRTSPQIVNDIKDHVSLKKDQVKTLIRTGTNHLAVQARNETLKENADILDGYQWVATLDSRTTFICMSRDGLIYPISDNPERSPKPPAHFGCRSTIVPKVKKEFELDVDGQRGAVGSSGRGVVSSKLNYEQWLRKQSKEFQIEVLGKERQRLFAQQRLPLSRFIDGDGRTLTLQELRDRDITFNQTTIQQAIRPTLPDPEAPTFTFRSTSEIKFKTPKEARKRLKAYVEEGNADPRQYSDTRFSGKKNWGSVSRFDDDIAVATEACLEDFDSLSRLFNIPKLRAIQTRRGTRVNASMGDATLSINQKNMGRRVSGIAMEGTDGNRGRMLATNRSAWNQGDAQNKPWSVESYQETRFDTYRSTMIHEFGHHVHQTYKFSPTKFNERLATREWNNFSPIEQRMNKLWRSSRKELQQTSPSQYGETKTVEWFAENFSAYFGGQKQRCSPKFIELIEDMIANAYK
jgi:SPP1 gp7 family putative phage head morphogenesis protein